MLSTVKAWFAVLDRTASAVIEYSHKLNDYRNESYLDLDVLSTKE